MSEPARRHSTYADLMALPEGVRAEVLGGELIVQHHIPPAE